MPQWILFSEETNNFTIYQNLLTSSEIGVFEVSIQLIDVINEYSDYTFKVYILASANISVEKTELQQDI